MSTWARQLLHGLDIARFTLGVHIESLYAENSPELAFVYEKRWESSGSGVALPAPRPLGTVRLSSHKAQALIGAAKQPVLNGVWLKRVTE